MHEWHNVPWENLSLFLPACSFLRNLSPFLPTDRRSREKDFKKGSEFSNFNSSQGRSFKRPQGGSFNREKLFSVDPKWFINILVILLLHTKWNIFSVNPQNSYSTAALSFLQFPIDLLPGVCHKLHNPSYVLYFSTSLGSRYFPWVFFFLPFQSCVHVLISETKINLFFLLFPCFRH